MNVVRLKITIYVIDVNKVQDKLFSQLSMEVNNTSYIHLPEQKKKRVRSIFSTIEALQDFH